MAYNPWTELSEPSSSKAGHTELMKALGLHVMKKEWAESGMGNGRIFSTSLRHSTLKVHGTSEEMTIPVQTCTTVFDVKAMLAQRLMVPVGQLTFMYRQGCSNRVHRDVEQISSKVIVKGIKSFRPQPYPWPHPVGVLGAGYNGVKTGIKWLRDGSTNFVVFDRYDRVGGYCWTKAANGHTRLQTEFAAFHVWFGPEFGRDARCGGVPTPGSWECWPCREEVLRHLQHAAEEYGLLPHCRFSVNVESMEIVGRPMDHARSYDLTVCGVDTGEASLVKCCGLISMPGSMTALRLLEYPGEESFGGQIGYALEDGMTYEHLANSQAAILGCGASAIENVRICCEHSAKKVFLVCRRRHLLCPRVACWFVNQAAVAVPAAMLLKLFDPMFELAGLGDPFSYWSVHGKRTTPSVTISQSCGFGVGDVAFLALACGKLEVVEDTVKRLTARTVHLSKGGKLNPIASVVKAFGFVGDWAVDRLHKLKQLVGQWCDGDYRRPIYSDPLGVHASNFDSISVGLSSYYAVLQHKFFLDYPKEYHRAVDVGLLETLPANSASEDRPRYVCDTRYAGLVGSVMLTMCPKLGQLTSGLPKYKHDSMLKAHPLEQYLQLCCEEWDDYQEQWGLSDRIAYPYTTAMVSTWLEEHREATSSRMADDSLIPARTDGGEEQGYTAASYEWWTSRSPEARIAWKATKKAGLTAGRRSASAE